MKHIFALSALGLLLSGCATTGERGVTHGNSSLREKVALSVTELRALVDGLALPAGEVEAATVALHIERARLSVFAAATDQISRPGLAAKAELAALGVLLTLCRDRVRAADSMLPGSAEAATMARALSIGCIVPLTLVAG